MRRLTHLVVLAAFVFSCGGQWYVLQGVAWIKMIHDYSQMVPFSEAVGMTLSGQYPCAICKAIAEKERSQTDKICVVDKYEKKFCPAVFVVLAPPCASDFQYPECVSSLLTRGDCPPVPPPRSSLA